MFRHLSDSVDMSVTAEIIIGLDLSIIALRDTVRTRSDFYTLQFLLLSYEKLMNVWNDRTDTTPVEFLADRPRSFGLLSCLVHLMTVRSFRSYGDLILGTARRSALIPSDVIRVEAVLGEIADRART